MPIATMRLWLRPNTVADIWYSAKLLELAFDAALNRTVDFPAVVQHLMHFALMLIDVLIYVFMNREGRGT